jgi:hypothetical protein
MLPAKALELALARVAVNRYEGLLCRAVQSGMLYGFLHGKLYPVLSKNSSDDITPLRDSRS